MTCFDVRHLSGFLPVHSYRLGRHYCAATVTLCNPDSTYPNRSVLYKLCESLCLLSVLCVTQSLETRLCCKASETASVRLLTPSLERMLLT